MNRNNFLYEIIEFIDNLDVNFKLFDDSGSYVVNYWYNLLEIIYIIFGDL